MSLTFSERLLQKEFSGIKVGGTYYDIVIDHRIVTLAGIAVTVREHIKHILCRIEILGIRLIEIDITAPGSLVLSLSDRE